MQGESRRLVAGGGILISSWPARPEDSEARRALILNVSTEPEFRRRGLARQFLVTMIQWLKEQGFCNVFLHPSDEGRHLYEELGFVATNEMRLQLYRDGPRGARSNVGLYCVANQGPTAHNLLTFWGLPRLSPCKARLVHL
jgi:GNAT superfamily N-acetyltransferase